MLIVIREYVIKMENKKNVAVVIIFLILIIGVLSFIARESSLKESLLLSPSKDGEIGEKTEEVVLDTLEGSLIDAINEVEADDFLLAQNKDKLNNLLSMDVGKDYETIVLRFIEDPSGFPDSVEKPVILNAQDYEISIIHGEIVTETGDIESIDTIFKLVKKDQPLEEQEHLKLNFINKNSYEINFDSVFKSDIYKIDGQAYAVIDTPALVESEQESDLEESNLEEPEVLRSPLTGYQIYSPPNPYNQNDKDFAVMVPHNDNFPLPANTVSYLNGLFPNVTQYFLDNSENTATYTFTVYPISVPNNWDLSYNNIHNVNLVNFINVADPIIN